MRGTGRAHVPLAPVFGRGSFRIQTPNGKTTAKGRD